MLHNANALWPEDYTCDELTAMLNGSPLTIPNWMVLERRELLKRNELPPLEKRPPMREYVRLYREGSEDRVSLQTNITEEAQFMRKAAGALGAVLVDESDSGACGALLEAWMPQIVDVVCKLRGYKAPSVDEQIVLTVGRFTPLDSQLVATSEPAMPEGTTA